MSWRRVAQALRALFHCDAIYEDTSYPPPNVSPTRLALITPHSLKHTVPAVGPYLGIPSALAEAGAWAGSKAERASAAKMLADAKAVPTGLSTALKYARTGMVGTAPLVMECVIVSVRDAIRARIEIGEAIPETWAALLEEYWVPAKMASVPEYPALTMQTTSAEVIAMPASRGTIPLATAEVHVAPEAALIK